jgi:hypothetical protein
MEKNAEIKKQENTLIAECISQGNPPLACADVYTPAAFRGTAIPTVPSVIEDGQRR